MRVKLVDDYNQFKKGETLNVKDHYGLRLIEQGKAVLVHEKVRKTAKVATAPEE